MEYQESGIDRGCHQIEVDSKCKTAKGVTKLVRSLMAKEDFEKKLAKVKAAQQRKLEKQL